MFWALLLALWRTLEDVLGLLGGVLEALEAPRRPKTAQDGCKACKDGFKLAGRAQRASERSERSERSDQEELRRVDGKRWRGGTAGQHEQLEQPELLASPKMHKNCFECVQGS